MITYKKNNGKALATIKGSKVYFSNVKGFITSVYDKTDSLDLSKYTEVVKFPTDFQKELTAWETKVQERLRKYNEYLYEMKKVRKEEIMNIWNWRKGKISAFRVRQYTQSTIEGKCYNNEILNSSIVFTRESAEELFNSIKESCTPTFEQGGLFSSNACALFTELQAIDDNVEDRIYCLNEDDLNEYFNNYSYVEEDYFYSPELKDCEVIITYNYKKNNFVNTIRSIDFIYNESTYSDLGTMQKPCSISELINEYDIDTAILHGIITKDNAKEYLCDSELERHFPELNPIQFNVGDEE